MTCPTSPTRGVLRLESIRKAYRQKCARFFVQAYFLKTEYTLRRISTLLQWNPSICELHLVTFLKQCLYSIQKIVYTVLGTIDYTICAFYGYVFILFIHSGNFLYEKKNTLKPRTNDPLTPLIVDLPSAYLFHRPFTFLLFVLTTGYHQSYVDP